MIVHQMKNWTTTIGKNIQTQILEKYFIFHPLETKRRMSNRKEKAGRHSLIGTKVRIYWPMEDEWFEGEITDYHLKKANRVLYDDGEHEWINLRRSKTV